jgi:hypothetical protein
MPAVRQRTLQQCANSPGACEVSLTFLESFEQKQILAASDECRCFHPAQRSHCAPGREEVTMGAKYLGSYVGMARPILAERDYQAVKRLVVDRCHGIYLLLEAERLEALIRELTLYEDRSGEWDGGGSLAVPAPQNGNDKLPHRRWSDAT